MELPGLANDVVLDRNVMRAAVNADSAPEWQRPILIRRAVVLDHVSPHDIAVRAVGFRLLAKVDAALIVLIYVIAFNDIVGVLVAQ